MGVTGLWTILAPVREHKELGDLRGETLAVDLSIWVCETQSVQKMHGVVTKPYLRNLFFRVSHLTQLGVKLVFVIDGKAPELKWQEMSRRNKALGRGRGNQVTKGNRSNFNRIIKECCELLDLLGIPYVQSKGEAEAMCAALNACGLVDACITDDGDAFLYGARKVYRNFTMNSKDPHVESYSMAVIETRLGLTRQSLVAAALLLGCDYLPGGVHGVGLERVVKLLSALSQVDILKRFERWARMDSGECVNKVEQMVRQKALAVLGFPQQEVISEFLTAKETIPSRQFSWKRPIVQQAQSFAEVKLEWPPDYTLEKVLPLVTLWDMTHISHSHVRHVQHLQPRRIVKTRVRHGVSVFEVEWHKEDTDTTYPKDYYTTLEEQSLFSRSFPDVVEQFNTDIEVKRSKKRGSKKKTTSVEDSDVTELVSQVESISLNLPQPSADDRNKCRKTINTENPTLSTKSVKKIKTKTAKKNSEHSTNLGAKSQSNCYEGSHTSKDDQLISNHTQSTVVKNITNISVKRQTKTAVDLILLDSDEEKKSDSENKESDSENKESDSENKESDKTDDESEEELFLTLTQRILLRSNRNMESKSTVSNSSSQLTSTSVSCKHGNELTANNRSSQIDSATISGVHSYRQGNTLTVPSSCSLLHSGSITNVHTCRQGNTLTVPSSCSLLHSGSITNVHTYRQRKEPTISNSCSQLPSASSVPARSCANESTKSRSRSQLSSESDCVTIKKNTNRIKSNRLKSLDHLDEENSRKNKALNICGSKNNKLKLTKTDLVVKPLIHSSTKEHEDKTNYSSAVTTVSESGNSFVSLTDNYVQCLTLSDCKSLAETTESCQQRGSSVSPDRLLKDDHCCVEGQHESSVAVESVHSNPESCSNIRTEYSTGQVMPMNKHLDNSLDGYFSDCSPFPRDHPSNNSFLEFGNFNMQHSMLTDLSLMTTPNPSSGNCFILSDESHLTYVQSPLLFDSPDISFNQVNCLNSAHIPFRNGDQAISLKRSKMFMKDDDYEDTESIEKLKDNHSAVETIAITSDVKSENKVLKNTTVNKTNDERHAENDDSYNKEIMEGRTYNSRITETCSENPHHKQNVHNVDKGNNWKTAFSRSMNAPVILTNSLQKQYSTFRSHYHIPVTQKCLIVDEHQSDFCLQNSLNSELDVICLNESQKESSSPCFHVQDKLLMSETTSSLNMICDNSGHKMENNLFVTVTNDSPSVSHTPNSLSCTAMTGGNPVTTSHVKLCLDKEKRPSFCFPDISVIQEHSPTPLSLADRLRLRLTGKDQIALENLSQK